MPRRRGVRRKQFQLAARKRADERLAGPPVDVDIERARIALLKALVSIQVASYARTRV